MPKSPDKNARKHETSRILRVNYTDEEKLELGKQLAEAHNDSAQVAADLDRVKADFKAKQSVLDEKIGQLSRGISTGYQMKDVKCKWEMDAPKGNWKTLRRLDTNEVVETAEMTESEKQAEMPLEDGMGAIAGTEAAKIPDQPAPAGAPAV